MPKIPAEKDDGDTFMRQISELMTSEDYSPEKEQLRNAVQEELEDALADLPKEQRHVFEQTEFSYLKETLCREISQKSVAGDL